MKQFISILIAIILLSVTSYTAQAQSDQRLNDDVYTSVSDESGYFPCPNTIQVGDFVYQLNNTYSYWFDYRLVNGNDIPVEVRYDSKIQSAIAKKIKQTYSDYDINVTVYSDMLDITDKARRADQDNKRNQTINTALAKIVGEYCTATDDSETETTTSDTHVGYYSGVSSGSYGSKPVHVKSYTRVQNGKVVHVRSHYRSAPRRR